MQTWREFGEDFSGFNLDFLSALVKYFYYALEHPVLFFFPYQSWNRYILLLKYQMNPPMGSKALMKSQVALPMKVWCWTGQFPRGWLTILLLLGFKMHFVHLWYTICVMLDSFYAIVIKILTIIVLVMLYFMLHIVRSKQMNLSFAT